MMYSVYNIQYTYRIADVSRQGGIQDLSEGGARIKKIIEDFIIT